jgi:hypothetical protein
MRQHAQLDLRIVGRNEDMPWCCHKATPDLAALLGAGGDILQIRVVAAQSAGRRAKLAVGRMYAPSLGVHNIG